MRLSDKIVQTILRTSCTLRKRDHHAALSHLRTKDLHDHIIGRQIVPTRMREGDKREVYIQAQWGYGAIMLDDIPVHSTLIFEIELVKIER